MPPNIYLSLEANKAHVQETHKAIANEKAVLNGHVNTCCGYSPRAQHKEKRQKNAPKNAHLPISPWKGSNCILLPEGPNFECSKHGGAGYNPSPETREAGDITPAFPLWHTATIQSSHQYLPRRSLYTLLVFQLLQLPHKGLASKSTSSDSQQGLHSQVPKDCSKQISNF